MKKIVALLIGIASFAMVCSCEPETTLMVSESVLNFEKQGGKASVTMVANKVWEASSNQSWCKVSPTLGDGTNDSNFALSITCDRNETYDARTCQITIKCAERTATISINQKETLGIGVPKRDYEVTYEAQTISIEVQSNVDYSVVTSQDWLKITNTKGLTPSTITVAVNENDGNNRVGKITIQAFGQTVVDVSIKQQATPHIVVFEDKTFERYCLNSFDKNKDGVLTYKEAEEVESIEVFINSAFSFKNISGIEYFTNLKSLSIDYYSYFNFYIDIDVSKNTKLEYLKCPAYGLDISGCIALKELHCELHSATSLDLSNCVALTHLDIVGQLKQLDISRNTALTWLQISSPLLEQLDISRNTALTHLNISCPLITTLNVSDCKALESLSCMSTKLTSLDLRGLSSLCSLECSYTPMASLDVSGCIALEILRCGGCQLTSLDVSSCSILNTLYCIGNPQLTTIWLKQGQEIANLSYDRNVTTIKYK